MIPKIRKRRNPRHRRRSKLSGAFPVPRKTCCPLQGEWKTAPLSGSFCVPEIRFPVPYFQRSDPMAVQAIAGVSSSSEAVVMTEYPSIAAGGVGQLLGRLYECLPLKIFGFGPSLSHLFALLTSPLGVLLYALQKLFGHRYELTNRAVKIWASRSDRLISSIGLSDFDHIELHQLSGQVFYKASDIRFVGAAGETLLKLSGVKDAGAFKNAIERAAEAGRFVKSSMARIEARA